MKTVLALALLLPTLVMAKDAKRVLIEARLLNAMTETQSLIKTYGLHEMTDEQLIGAINKLEKIKNVTRGQSEENLKQSKIICEKNNNQIEIKEARRKIFELANSLVGLRYDERRSTEYVNYWISQYSCEAADSFVNDFKTVETFASMGLSETEGLHYVNDDSIEYAKNMTKFYCTGLNLPKIFKMHFTKAVQLGYKKQEARGYAQLRTEEEAFICKKQ